MNTDTLIAQHRLSPRMLKANTVGLSHEDSLFQPQPEGNCLNWVVGHLVHSRLHILALLGAAPSFLPEKFARYAQGSTPVTSEADAVRFEELMEAFLALQEPLEFSLGAKSFRFP